MRKKKTKIQIMSIYGNVLFEYECVDNTIKKTVEEALNKGANLGGAALRGAKNLQPIYFSELYNLKLLTKDTKIRMWKYLENGKSPYRHAIYEVGKTYKENKFDTDEFVECSYGLNVSTLTWCLRDSLDKSNIDLIELEFRVSDIVAIPYFTDGKFRVKQFKVLRKITRGEGMKIMYKISGIKKDEK